MERTGLKKGSRLTPAAITELYDEETGPAPLPYILHTESSLQRMDALKAFHVHALHRTLTLDDPIPSR